MYTVKDILDSKGLECHTVSPKETVYNALKKMAGHNIGALPVVENGKVIGIFSERDYARKIILMGKTSKDSTVGDMMTDRVYVVKLNSRTGECMQLMTTYRVRHLPVVENDELLGIVSIGDVVNKTIQEQSNTINQLEDYIIGKR